MNNILDNNTEIDVYGGSGTIHGTKHVNVEVDEKGEVVAVWFRWMPLRFDATVVPEYRAKEMRTMYKNGEIPALVGLALEKRNKDNVTGK